MRMSGFSCSFPTSRLMPSSFLVLRLQPESLQSISTKERRTLREGKSPGDDKVPARLIKLGQDRTIKVITDMCQRLEAINIYNPSEESKQQTVKSVH